MSERAMLVLETGEVFTGTSFGAAPSCGGEVVFNTSMTGYQEILTDPSYAGQIVVMTAAEIGNVGVNPEDAEAERPACCGMVVRELSPVVSNWRSHESLSDYMGRHGVVGLSDVDTRALTRALREHGAVRGVVGTGSAAELVERAGELPSMAGANLVPRVTCAAPFEWTEPLWSTAAPEVKRHVVVYDYGAKREIYRHLVSAGCRVTVVPFGTPATEAEALGPDGYLLSNGPGDPAAVEGATEIVRELIAQGRPLMGICLGFQILALAGGARTFKLPFGHHGGNHPVKDLATGKVAITSQNHGFAVDPESLPSGVEMTHVNLYDGTMEGFRHTHRPVFGVQYHPEASPGPHDASSLIERLCELIDAR